MNKIDSKIFSSEGSKVQEKAIIGIGSYEKTDHILKSLNTATGLTINFIKINGVLFLLFGKNKGNFFPDNEIPNLLGFNGIHDGSGYQIGYKML